MSELVKFDLSLFSVTGIIPLAKKVSKETFSSIVSPPDNIESIVEIVGLIKADLKVLLKRYLPHVDKLPLYQGLKFVPTWKALPTHPMTRQVWTERMGLARNRVRRLRSSFTSFSHELANWTSLLNVVHSNEGLFSPGVLWPPRIRYADDVNNKMFTPSDLDWFEARYRPLPAQRIRPGYSFYSREIGSLV